VEIAFAWIVLLITGAVTAALVVTHDLVSLRRRGAPPPSRTGVHIAMTEDTPEFARLTDEEIESLRLMPFVTSLNVGTGVYATEEEKTLYFLAVAHYNAKLRVIADLQCARADIELLQAMNTDLMEKNEKLSARDAELSALEAAGVDNWEGYSQAFAEEDDFFEEDEDVHELLHTFHEHCEGYGSGPVTAPRHPPERNDPAGRG
jgi:hypothetical protein